jgi:transcriptional regulator with XRE-family HTH domain
MGDGPAFGRELRRRREASDLTLGELAEKIYFSRSYISRVERGQRPARRQLAELCDQVLDAGGELAALVPPG